MAVTDRVCAKKEAWHTSCLLRLQKCKSSDDTELVPDTTLGRKNRLDGRCHNLLDFGRKERKLAGRNRRAGQ